MPIQLPKNTNPNLMIGDAVINAAKAIGAQLDQSPLGTLNPLNFHPDQFLPRLQSTVKDYNDTLGHMDDARLKRKQGIQPTTQDLANEKKGMDFMMGMAGGVDAPAEMAGATTAEKTLPKIVKPNVLKKAAMNLNQTSTLHLPSDIKGAGKEAFVQQVLNDEVPGNTLALKYQNLQPTMDKFSGQIHQKLAANPQVVPANELEQAVVKRAQDIVDSGKMTQEQATEQAKNYVQNLYTKLLRERLPEGENFDINQLVNTTGYTTPDVFQMKTDANALNRSAIQDRMAGTGLTPQQQIHLVGRDALDDIVTKYHPDVKDLTTKQSALFQAADDGNLGNLRNQSTGFGVSIPGTPAKIGVPGFIASPIRQGGAAALNIAGDLPSPVLKTLGAAGLVGAGVGADKLYQSVTNPNGSQNNPQGGDGYPAGGGENNAQANIPGNQSNNHGANIPGSYLNVKPDQSGDYHLQTQTQPSGLYMSQGDFQQATAGLTPGTPEYSRVRQKYDDSQKLAANALSGDKLAFMQNAPSYVAIGNQVKQDLHHLPTGFLNRFKNWSDVKSYYSDARNPYATELADIDALNTQYMTAYQEVTSEKKSPGDAQLIQPGDSPQQATQKWDRMMKFIVGNHAQRLEPYLAITSPGGVQTPQGQPVGVPSQQPQAPQSATSMIQGGTLPPINLPAMNIPQSGGLPPMR